jgi:hypothetical protein
MNYPLTGRWRHRTGVAGELIMQVQYVRRTAAPEGPSFDRVQLLWRDARMTDFRGFALDIPMPREVEVPVEELPGECKPN